MNSESNGDAIALNQQLSVSELLNLVFFDQSVNGPIGRVSLSATDLIGAEGT